jgi:hypothetical protein
VTTAEVEARRALVLHDCPLIVDLIELTLNHGLQSGGRFLEDGRC